MSTKVTLPARETLKETALETTCELCGSVTDELESGAHGLYVCHDCYEKEGEE